MDLLKLEEVKLLPMRNEIVPVDTTLGPGFKQESLKFADNLCTMEFTHKM